jgi:hypothetical protein
MTPGIAGLDADGIVGRSLTESSSSRECRESPLFLLAPSSLWLTALSPRSTADLRDFLFGSVMRSATFSNLRASLDVVRDWSCGLVVVTSSGTPLGSPLGGTRGRSRINGSGSVDSKESFGGGGVGVMAREMGIFLRDVGVGTRWLAPSLIAPGYHSGLKPGSGVADIGNCIFLSDRL